MLKYIVKRLVYGLSVLWGVVTIIFFLFNLLPGDPARLMLGNRPTPEAIEAINRDLGRDKPLSTQYLMYINDLSPISFHQKKDKNKAFFLDEEKYEGYSAFLENDNRAWVFKAPYLRRSYKSRRKVWDVIAKALPNTSVLAMLSMGFALFFGVVIGTVAAVNKGTKWDAYMLVVAVLGMALPSFFSGKIIQVLFTDVWFQEWPSTGSLIQYDYLTGEDMYKWAVVVLPAFTLGIRPLAIIMQLTRNALLDVLNKDFIRTAKAKGLSYYKLLFKHALRNALNPVITAVSGWFAALLAGAIFVEKIFNYKGLGLALFEAVTGNDLPIAMGIVLFMAVAFVIVNILVDIIYVILDPRIRLK